MGVDHPFEYRSHYNHRGEVCHCPWGGGKHRQEHLGFIKEASKLDWLKERPDMQDDKGQDWIRFLSEPYSFAHGGDKLLPWLTREWKKGRLHTEPASGWLRYDVPGADLSKALMPGDVWAMQDSLEEMKKRKQGIDVMQHKVHELIPKVEEFQDWKQAQERMDLGEILHKFDDGWTVRRLQNEDEHRDEGQLMGHCVGDPTMPYIRQTEQGDRIFASLRDHKNLPHATMELTPDNYDYGKPQVGSSSRIEQFFGKEDQPPLEEYQDRMNEWLKPHGIEAGDGYDAEYEVPGADSIEDYNYSADGGYTEWAYDDPGANIGENTEIYQAPHNYDSIAQDYLHPDTDDQDRETLFRKAREQSWDFNDVERALYTNMEDTPEHQNLMNQWEGWKEPWYHPYTGEFQKGTTTPPVERFQNRLFNDRWVRDQQPADNGNRFQYNPEDLNQPPTDLGPVQGPWHSPYIPWTKNPNLASARKPFYYRWIFSPTKGVTLGSNEDEHPALVPYHQELGGQVDGQDLYHGYAYRIGNGWRLTDWEHRPVEDPFIVAQVVRSLGLKKSPEKRSEGSWHPVGEDNWDRLHYALPAATELA